MYPRLHRPLLSPDTIVGGAGSTGGQPSDANPPTPDIDDELLQREFKYTADGASRTETLAEILKRASKSFGADEAFRKAAELRETAKALTSKADAHDALLSTIEKFKSRDESAFRRMAELLEMDRENPGIADELWQFLSGKATLPEPGASPRPATGNPAPPAGSVDPNLAKQLQQMAAACKEMGVDLATGMRLALNASGRWADTEAKKRIENALTHDKILGIMLKRNPESRSTLVETVYQDAKGRVENEVPIDEAINGAIKKAAAFASLVAASSAPTGNAALPQQYLGVGPAPIAAPSTGIHPTKRPTLDRSKLISDPNYSREFIEQLQAHLQQAEEE